jgi:hypothetical protein
MHGVLHLTISSLLCIVLTVDLIDFYAHILKRVLVLLLRILAV